MIEAVIVVYTLGVMFTTWTSSELIQERWPNDPITLGDILGSFLIGLIWPLFWTIWLCFAFASADFWSKANLPPKNKRY